MGPFPLLLKGAAFRPQWAVSAISPQWPIFSPKSGLEKEMPEMLENFEIHQPLLV